MTDKGKHAGTPRAEEVHLAAAPSEPAGPRHARGRPGQRRTAWRRSVVRGLVLALACTAALTFFLSDHAYVQTPSMYPTIPPGSMVFLHRQPRYRVGEVIEFRGNGIMWVHRLVAVKPNGDLVTKGDNPQSTADVFVPPLTMKDVVGSVYLSVPYLGFPELVAHDPAYGLSWLRAELGLPGRIALVIAVAGGSVYAVSRRRRQPGGAHCSEATATA